LTQKLYNLPKQNHISCYNFYGTSPTAMSHKSLATVMHCDTGCYLIHGHTCIGVQSNREEPAHANLSPSVPSFF